MPSGIFTASLKISSSNLNNITSNIQIETIKPEIQICDSNFTESTDPNLLPMINLVGEDRKHSDFISASISNSKFKNYTGEAFIQLKTSVFNPLFDICNCQFETNVATNSAIKVSVPSNSTSLTRGKIGAVFTGTYIDNVVRMEAPIFELIFDTSNLTCSAPKIISTDGDKTNLILNNVYMKNSQFFNYCFSVKSATNATISLNSTHIERCTNYMNTSILNSDLRLNSNVSMVDVSNTFCSNFISTNLTSTCFSSVSFSPCNSFTYSNQSQCTNNVNIFLTR